jgi:predicted histone-like DNA-binding protein
MPIIFNVVQRGNPAKPDAPKKYYPSIQSNGRMSLRELAELAADRSTLSTADIMAAVESFLYIIPEALAEGKVVELGDLVTSGSGSPPKVWSVRRMCAVITSVV